MQQQQTKQKPKKRGSKAKAKAPRPRTRNPYRPPRPSARARENIVRRRMKVGMQDEYYDYLLSLLHPWTVTSVILPDWATFPRGVAQIRTTGTISTGSSAANFGFFMTITPALYKSLYFSGPTSTNAKLVIDGVTYSSPSQPSVHNYATSWANVLGTFRVVSMGVRLKSIGPPLTTAGQVTCACTPPRVNVITNFNDLSAYNYAYTGPASNGLSIVWLPAGITNFQNLEPDFVWPLDDTTVIQLAAIGLPADTTVFTMEWVINIETYSTDQLLTANAQAGKPDAEKLSESLSMVSQALVEKKTAGTHDSAGDRARDVLKTVVHVGETVAKDALKTGIQALVTSLV